MPLLALIFVFSGAAGLIYESVWARYVSLLVGHSAYAQVIVLVIFLGGMAIGAFGVGGLSGRIRSPLLWYAIAETAIGLFAFRFHNVFVAVTRLAYEQWLPPMSPGFAVTATMWSVAALLILPQSILLGATFPLMTAGAIRRYPDRPGASLGLLYFANSFGAAIGALLEGFVLIGRVGLEGTLHVAGWLNVLVAAAVIAFFVRPRVERPVPKKPAGRKSKKARLEELTPATAPRHLGAVLLLVGFATAFSSFFYEIAWTRMLSLVHGSTTHSFELMLSAFVLGLALGALWISRRADASADPLVLLARLQWAMGIAAIATLPLYIMTFDWTASLLPRLSDTDRAYNFYSVARYAMTLGVMLPATFCAGTTLPLITRTWLSSGSGERAIGIVYGVNTIGSIIGAAVAALILLPIIGLKGLLIGGATIDIAVGVALIFWRNRSTPSAHRDVRLWWATAATAAALILIGALSPFSPARMASGVYRYGAVPDPEIFRYLFYRDGRTASVSVRQERADTSSLIAIVSNGKPDASVPPAWIRPYRNTDPKLPLDEDMAVQTFLSWLTLAYSPGARVGAVVGQGSGVTSHMLLGSPTLTRLHTIEIEPEMIRGSRLFYPGNRRVFDDQRSRFETDDARAFLATTGPRFDFVLSEPSNPWVSGVSSLYTIEFYERVRRRLMRDGILVQWLHMYEADDAMVASVLASIDWVFPSYRVYMTSTSDMVVIAGAGSPLQPPDWSVLSAPGIVEDMRRFLPVGPEVFAAAEIGGRVAFHGALSRARINSDYAPYLDLNAERHRFRKDYAVGFRDLVEMRHDIPAAIENRRRGFGTASNPTPEILRTAALARGSRFRDGLAGRPATSSSPGDSLQQSFDRVRSFQARLLGAKAPDDWRTWLADFVHAEAELHGGTAGVADERFYSNVRRYMASANAPGPVRTAVNLYHGLAAWDFGEVALSGGHLIDDLATGNQWVQIETLRIGTALAWLRLGNPNAAQTVYERMAAAGPPGTLADRIIMGLIEERFVPPVTGRP